VSGVTIWSHGARPNKSISYCIWPGRGHNVSETRYRLILFQRDQICENRSLGIGVMGLWDYESPNKNLSMVPAQKKRVYIFFNWPQSWPKSWIVASQKFILKQKLFPV
jgi:hypothetical protein